MGDTVEKVEDEEVRMNRLVCEAIGWEFDERLFYIGRCRAPYSDHYDAIGALDATGCMWAVRPHHFQKDVYVASIGSLAEHVGEGESVPEAAGRAVLEWAKANGASHD